ncbi:helix-turn-helix domain-containing protein [Candidatus Kinetoplastidibacterium crithidiae]|uniref:Anaerobic CRP/FNR family transcriptional regulator n=1 Tax=Candidatus Kinetoplastidibacterium crithidiae TCC036E TaxID=1208918 RepID=M1L412_9PROT|nr:helix-turn-helix domain-containing protein [Candidatus Kinetoplastibacterium crithidii]AFZ82468.1 CRP/FNR family transcriptional regulator, anaerobic regulatory protein [Candidatus Kinetoplastibacterium crithidii (ex Angomonas deanei ATCC 30255)]AGF47478.1 anaerobic CRP/FNR family transcriptional regulator [Candidatus Kinetoplastibacterium crithidii TCC036E]
MLYQKTKSSTTNYDCSACILGHICVASDLNNTELNKINNLKHEKIQIKKKEKLLISHQQTIYGVRYGSLKIQIEKPTIFNKIVEFCLPGELIGLNNLHNEKHEFSVIALENSELCIINIQHLDHISQDRPYLQKQFREIMSKEITKSHYMLSILSLTSSKKRVIAFLLNMSSKYEKLGYSSNNFILKMSRKEIGNFLGITLETVSRILNQLMKEKMILIKNRNVILKNKEQLKNQLLNQ